MFRILFRIFSRPVSWALSIWIRFRLALRLRKGGVLEIELEASKAQKKPLWVRQLVQAAAHPRIRILHLKIRPGKWGWAELEDLRIALRAISDGGTPVVASLETADNAGMFLASACDHVLLAPLGEVFLGGVGLEMHFIGDAMERLGLKFEVVSAGDYKSAAEPLSRAFPSEANREAINALVADLHARFRAQVAGGRGLEEDALQELMEGGLLSGPDAVDLGLVDALCYEPEIETFLQEKLGTKPRCIEEKTLLGAVRWQQRLRTAFSKRPAIQVLHLEGAIVRDAPKLSRKTRITQEETLEAIESLIERPPKAVVLLVNSPGGSALVSDLIWEAMGRLNAVVPVVACFGNVAASGGYFVSAGCREIVAQETSLTGSIGVISGKLVTGSALARIGIHMERVSGAQGGGLLSMARPLSQEQRALLRLRIQEIYTVFKSRVEEGRSMDESSVEAVAQGRVWTGAQAKERGLVDHTGGLETALERAASLGSISLAKAKIRYKKVEKPKPFWTRFMTQAPLDLEVLVKDQLNMELQVFLRHPAEPLALWPLSLQGD